MSDAGKLAEEPPELRPGTLVDGKYELLELLGQGGYGSVWRARDRALQGDVAIKLLVGRRDNPEVIQRFAREGEALQRLRVPGVVRVRAAGEAGGLRYLVMELVEGADLTAWLATTPALPQRLEVAVKLARALAAMHDAGVIHRDIKASNVMMAADGPVLVDLGLAKLPDRAPITRVGAGGGTPGKVAPEQWGTLERATAAADVYALGVLLFWMLSGRDPYGAPPEVEPEVAARAVIAEQHQRPAPRLGSQVSGLPESLDVLVAKMMDRDPAQRPSMAEVIEAIEGVSLNAAEPTHLRAGGPELRSSWRQAGIVALAAGLLAAVMAIVALRPAPGPAPGAQAHGALDVREAGASAQEVPLEDEGGQVEVRGLQIEHRPRAAGAPGAEVRLVGAESWQVTTATATARLVAGPRTLSVRWLPADAAPDRR